MNISNVSDSDSDSDIPEKIQDKYDILMSILRDGSDDPDINEVEDKIKKYVKNIQILKVSGK